MDTFKDGANEKDLVKKTLTLFEEVLSFHWFPPPELILPNIVLYCISIHSEISLLQQDSKLY